LFKKASLPQKKILKEKKVKENLPQSKKFLKRKLKYPMMKVMISNLIPRIYRRLSFQMKKKGQKKDFQKIRKIRKMD
jgi:hypothetical protein